MAKFVKVDLMEGLSETGSGAFDAKKMAEDDLTNAHVSMYLAKKLGPIASEIGAYLKNGAGFGVICHGDEVTLIGLAPEDHPHD